MWNLPRKVNLTEGNIIRLSKPGHGFSRIPTDQSKEMDLSVLIRGNPWPGFARRILRRFNQLHLAVASAVKHHHFALGIAEDEDIAVAKVGFFDGFFQSHRAHGD